MKETNAETEIRCLGNRGSGTNEATPNPPRVLRPRVPRRVRHVDFLRAETLMSEQLSFVTLGGKLVDVPGGKVKASTGQAKGWAAYPGSGPKGEFCGTCIHAYRIQGRSKKIWWKCDLVKPTHGPGTDIRLKWEACHRWGAKLKPVLK